MASAVTVTKGARGDFGWVFWLLSSVMSALALIALAQHAFVTWSLSAPMALVMDQYQATMQVLFGWAHPYLQAFLTWLGSFIGWRPTLYPHWRDVLVLTALLGGGIARASGIMFAGFMIGAICLPAALVAGMLPLQSPNLAIQLLIATTFGLVSLLIRLIISIARRRISVHVDSMIVVVVGVFPVLATWLLSLAFGSVGGMGLAGLAMTIAVVGIALPLIDYLLTTQDAVDPLIWTISRTMLGGFIGGALFFAIDAGLKLLMG